MTQAPDRVIPFFNRVTYGLADLGVGIFVTVKNVLLLSFMVQYLGIEAVRAGFIIFAVLLLDIVTDPLVGWLSDNTKSRFGRRIPYIFVGAIVMSLATLALFSVPEVLSGGPAAIWVSIAFILATFGYTLIIIPHGSLTAEMTSNPIQRSALTGWRMVWFSIGILLVGGLLPWIIAAFGNDRAAHALGYGFMIPAILIPVGLTCLFVRSYDQGRVKQRVSPFEQAEKVFSNTGFLLLMLVYSVQLFGFALITQSISPFVNYLIVDNGQNALSFTGGDQPSKFALMFGVVTLASILSQPLWTAVSAHLGKMNAYMLGIAGFTLVQWGLYFALPSTNVTEVALWIFAAGVFYGCLLQLPWALLPDVIDRSLKDGDSLVGAFNGYWLLGQKIAQALAPLVLGFLLSSAGYLESTTGFAASQPQSAINALHLAMTLVPAFCFAVSVVCLFLIRGYVSRA